MLPAHVLSGCDSVSSLWGIGKGTALKVLKKAGEECLNKLGNMEEHDDDIKNQCTSFIASCYGYPQETNMSSL